jgi:hypothetical protein
MENTQSLSLHQNHSQLLPEALNNLFMQWQVSWLTSRVLGLPIPMRGTVTFVMSTFLMFTVAGTAPDFHGVPFSSESFDSEPMRAQVAQFHINHHETA